MKTYVIMFFEFRQKTNYKGKTLLLKITYNF